MGILLMVHSLVRWAILIIALAAVVRFAVGWLRGGAFGKNDRLLAASFSGLMDAQALLGVIFLIWSLAAGGGFSRYRAEHVVLMVVAVAVAHLPSRWKNAPDAVRFRNSLAAVVGSLLLIVLGISALPQGWLG